MSMITTPFPARATAAEVLAGVDLTGQRFLVTGGSSGLGAATVRALAGAGALVTIATRDPAAGAPLAAELPGVDARALDLADPASVASFVAGWTGPLHGLVANAGIMALPTRQVTPQGWELQLATNFLGHFQLVTGLHDALADAGGRVAVVSSGAQLLGGVDFADPQFERRPYDPWVAYAQSKTADVLLAAGLGRRWAGDGITANAVAPGWVHTNLQRHLDAATLQAAGAMDAEGNRLTPAHYKTPEQGAASSVLVVASPLLAGFTGRYVEDNQEAPVVPGGTQPAGPAVADWAVDPVAADRLWELALTVG